MCGLGDQTEKHVVQDCPEYNELRKKFWSSDVTLNHKLFGTKEELRKAAEFIIGIKLVV